MRYNWQQPDWPEFTYDLHEVEDHLYTFATRVGRMSGMMSAISEELQVEAVIALMVTEAIKTSEIEGEYLSRQDVMSSIRNNLGLLSTPEQVRDKRAEGAAALMIDVRNSYAEPLTEDKLFNWHRLLMQGSRGITIGAWRTHEDPMQVVSGPMGRERVHFEGPPSAQVPGEMACFIAWFNEKAPGGPKEIKKPVIRAAIAHLYFESIHPFEDGNGRIGRAIAEKALAQSVSALRQSEQPLLLSLSRAIEANKKAYYESLQEAQRSNEISSWIRYFVGTTLEAQQHAEKGFEFSLQKTKFFDRYQNQLNERQLKVIRRMLEAGPEGFEGGMNARKWISITQASKATATRDLQALAEQGIFIPVGGGRSTRYELNLVPGVS